MSSILDRIAAAPITWGVSEVPGWGHQLSPRRVLDEMRSLGVNASELGPDGFFARDGSVVSDRRATGFSIIAGFVPIALRFPGGLVDSPQDLDQTFARLGESGAEYAVLAIVGQDSGYDVRPRLHEAQWEQVGDALEAVGRRAVAAGVKPVVHPHIGTYIESGADAARILERSSIDICLDVGHLALAGDDPAELVDRLFDRIQHVHLKDVDLEVASAVRQGDTSYYDAVKEGLFKPLGQGDLKIADIVNGLEVGGYRGWYVLEQDVVLTSEPAPGSGPAQDAATSVEYLKRLAAERPRAARAWFHWSHARESRMNTIRLTTAQALVRFLSEQYVERDGVERRFFAGVFGIFGHGNVAGVGQALHQYADGLRYYLARNEQAMVHTAAAYAKMTNRLSTFACTSSVGPGATNMVTAAAGATINRVPVLLLPGDTFATRRVAPVLQQLEMPTSEDISVNDTLKPVSRYWDRINRPEQLVPSVMAAMRTLTDQAETGAVTLALPQDVQAEAWDYPQEFFQKRVWRIGRPLPDASATARAVELIRTARRPLIVAGGGVIYSEATSALRRLVESTGIPVGETQAGKGALPYDHTQALGAIGSTGTTGANHAAREADLVIGVGTRYSDFTTASRTAFAHPSVRFININVAGFDAYKLAGLPLVGDARATLGALATALAGYQVDDAYRSQTEAVNGDSDREVSRIYGLKHDPLPAQAEVIGAVNEFSQPGDVVVAAAGSLPGDLHKLWRTRDPKGYHVEYGYSCMGYEVAGGLGVKMADPEREVYVMVGDSSWLMMSSEVVTSVQEGLKLTIILIDNHGFASIGALSESVGTDGFGTEARYRGEDGQLSGGHLPIDLAANAASLGAEVIRARGISDFKEALAQARRNTVTTVIAIETSRTARVDSYDGWWDVPVAEVSEVKSVAEARAAYEEQRKSERHYL